MCIIPIYHAWNYPVIFPSPERPGRLGSTDPAILPIMNLNPLNCVYHSISYCKDITFCWGLFLTIFHHCKNNLCKFYSANWCCYPPYPFVWKLIILQRQRPSSGKGMMTMMIVGCVISRQLYDLIPLLYLKNRHQNAADPTWKLLLWKKRFMSYDRNNEAYNIN